jgi:hypothetical protein
VSALVFLGGALVLFLLFTAVALFRYRERNVSFHSSIESFKNDMGLLAPGERRRRRRSGRRR